jgi:hypothetical protein
MADPNNIQGYNEFYDLLFAYSVGCLDMEDLLELNEYFQSGDEFPWQELGEYQNLAALLPAILNMETPGPEIKDKVARKLYRIKNERRPPKISENIVRDKTAGEAKQNITDGEKVVSPDLFEQPELSDRKDSQQFHEVQKDSKIKQGLRTDSFSKVKNVHDESVIQKSDGITHRENRNIPKDDEIDTMSVEIDEVHAREAEKSGESGNKPYHLHGIPEKETEKKGKGGIFLLIILFIIAVLGFIFLYQRISVKVDTYKAGIDSLNKQVSDLNEQVGVDKDVQKILQMKDVHIINLYGSSINKDEYGKVIFSFENSSGFLQLSNIPALNNSNSFQLWMITEGKATALSTFKPVDSTHYFPISLPVQNYKGGIRFIVTEESAEGSTVPPNKVLLTGSLQ